MEIGQITRRLMEYRGKNRISFSMPGHKMRGLRELIDVTELDDTVDLHHPTLEVECSQRMLADFYGADQSLYLAGGSTAGIHAMITGVCKPGDRIAVSRGCHKSVMNICAMLDIELVLVGQECDRDFGILRQTEPEQVALALREYPDIKAVLITSPDYYGNAAELAEIAEIVHRSGALLLVDEAHGAHFAVSPLFPQTAMAAGADLVVQSAHKTLNALTPAAFLHMRGERISLARVCQAATMVQTSSPPYYVISSAEQAVLELQKDGTEKWEFLIKSIERENEKIIRTTRLLIPEGKNRDLTRIVFGFGNYEITGAKAAAILREKYRIDTEMSDGANVVCIATPSNKPEEIRFLYQSVEEICRNLPVTGKKQDLPVYPRIALARPAKAFFSQTERCAFETTEGRTAASFVGAYPPGIPLVYVGERVTAEMIRYVQEIKEKGVPVRGLEIFFVVKENG